MYPKYSNHVGENSLFVLRSLPRILMVSSLVFREVYWVLIDAPQFGNLYLDNWQLLGKNMTKPLEPNLADTQTLFHVVA